MEKKYYDEVLKEKLQVLIDGNGAQDIIRHICLDVLACSNKFQLTDNEYKRVLQGYIEQIKAFLPKE